MNPDRKPLLTVRGHRRKTFITLSGFWSLRLGEWGLCESVKKENLRGKSFLRIIWNGFLKICEKWNLLILKLIKATRNKRSGGSILQIFVRRTFKTWNASPNNVKNSKKYPLPTLTTYFDTSFTIQLYQVFRYFLVWYPSRACAVFSSSTTSTKIV